jgi:hypothetical protein
MLSDPADKHRLSYFNYLKWQGHIKAILEREGDATIGDIRRLLLVNITAEIDTSIGKMVTNKIISIDRNKNVTLMK